MTGPTRVGGKKLTMTIGGVEIHAEASAVAMKNEEASSDVTTFADAEEGGARQFYIEGTAVQSTDSDSFWTYVWDHTGETAAFVLRPHGNAVPSADQPHFTGTLTIGAKPDLGGEAGTKKDQTFAFRFDVDGTPAKDNGSTAVPTITSVSDETPAVGDPIQVNGTRFSGVTSVTIDGETAVFWPVTTEILVATVPDAATGAANLVVTNGDGASAPFALTISA